MKAIILAGGQGTRLLPLTKELPKAMVTVGGMSLLEHNMLRLLPYVDEFIIVVKYKKEAIVDNFGSSYRGIPIRYHEQGVEPGTGAAIKGIRAKGDLIIAYADAVISQSDIDAVMACPNFAVLVREVPNPEKYGIFQIDSNGLITALEEKPAVYIGNLANFGFFKVHDEILEMVESVGLSPRGEIEITDAIRMFFRKYPMRCVHMQGDFIDITNIADLERANENWGK